MSTGPDIKDLEGEYFVDVPTQPIPTRDMWGELNFQQLLEVRLQLENKAWAFSKNPVISRTLAAALAELNALIEAQI